MSAAPSVLVALAIILPLMFLGVHIGVALTLGALSGMYVFLGMWAPGMKMLLLQAIDVGTSYPLMVIPLFIFLGSLASASGITTDLFTMFYHWIGRVRGGIAIATIGTCAGMASITGSSVATSAAMTRIALPELRRFGYGERLSVGTIASGGTLSIMIPPSLTLVLYAIFAEQSVGKMLVAGVIPGICLATGFIACIYLHCLVWPDAGPRGPSFGWRERMKTLPGVLPFLLIVLAVIVGILLGIWTPVESAAVAVVLVAGLGWSRRKIGLPEVVRAAQAAIITSASVFMIVIGSMLFSNLLALSGVSESLTNSVIAFDLPPFGLFVTLILIYTALGMFMEVSSLMALTIPLVMPIIMSVGWDPIWFGVILVILMELAMVTPPVGLNLYAVKGVAPEVSLHSIYLGAAPFWVIAMLIVFAFYFVPEVVLLLPGLVY